MNRKKPLIIIALLLLCFTALIISTLTSCVYGRPVWNNSPAEFRLLDEVYSIIEKNYVDKNAIDVQKLTQGAITGLVNELQDPHAAYIEPQKFQDTVNKLQGKYEGIGAMVMIEGDSFVITGTIPGSPAEKAGIKAGDKLLKVDDVDTSGMDITELVARIRGDKGTSVKIQILHGGETTPVDFELVREELPIITVTSKKIDNLGYIQIRQFVEKTGEETAAIIDNLLQQNVSGIILDLRYNPGGILTVVIDVASLFIKEDGLVLYQIDSDGKRTDHKTKKPEMVNSAYGIPIVVLVNKYSASGSEVLPAALKFHNKAVLIGNKTFGKGSVNQLFFLSDGSGLYLTTGRWYTPDGQLIEGIGIEPDINVEVTEEDIQKNVDKQLDKAVEVLKNVTISVQ